MDDTDYPMSGMDTDEEANMVSDTIAGTGTNTPNTDPSSGLTRLPTDQPLYIKTSALFRRRYFSKIKTDLSATSLRRFQTFGTMYPDLASYVKEVIITASIGDEGCSFGRGFLWSRDQGKLNGIPAELLDASQAFFKSFPKCRSISLIRPGIFENNDTLCKCANPFYALVTYPILSISETFDIVLKAIANAGIPLESFTLNVNRFYDLDMAFIDTAFTSHPAFNASWSTLKRLDTSLPVRDTHQTSNYLMHLDSQDSIRDLLTNLATAYKSDTCTPAPALKEFHVNGAVISQGSLSDLLLANSRTFPKLSLEDIRLDAHGSISFLTSLQDGSFPNLGHLTLNSMSEFHSTVEPQSSRVRDGRYLYLHFPGDAEGENRDPICGKGFTYRALSRGSMFFMVSFDGECEDGRCAA
ncbi:hypothetical protein BDW74DRAFT_175158 [Aspergillus multicolor]|uniref:uncharacterized protein n=1 Tax=Aspergillus multicolor TaxID=41759 RepID=UPI003CCE3736